MNFKKRFFLWLVSVVVACGSGFLVTSMGRSGALSDSSEVVAIVDGEPIRDNEVSRVFASYQSRVLGEVVLSRLIAQNFGGKEGLKVDSKEIAFPPHLRSKEDYVAYGARLFPELYLRKEILYEWPTSRLRKCYTLFQDELAQYDYSVLEIVRKEDLPSVVDDLEQETDMKSLAARYSIDESGGKHEIRRWYSRAELGEEFGDVLADKLVKLKPHSLNKPIQVGSSHYVFYLNDVKKKFEEIRPLLEQRIVDARKVAYIYKLLEPSQVLMTGPLKSDPHAVEYRI